MRDRTSSGQLRSQGAPASIERQFEPSGLNLDHLANAVRMLLAGGGQVTESNLLFRGNRASHVVGREDVV